MNISVLVAILGMLFGFAFEGQAQDEPSGYTNNYKLRMWDEGAHPGADSVNQNLIDLDLHLYKRDQRIDSLKSAFTWMFNFPSGTFKRYDNTEFDNDTLKVKSGVFPKLALANTFTQAQTLSADQTNFGTTTHSLNFNIDNDQGGIFIRKNNSTTLLKWDEGDGLYWQFPYPITVDGDVDITGSYKVNGTPISTGGGDAFVGSRNTFTKRNIFDSLSVTKIVSDLPFYKGASTWIWTKDNYKLFLGANNDTAIEIGTNNVVRIFEDLQVDAEVSGATLTATSGLNNLTGETNLKDLNVTGNVNFVPGSFVISDIITNKTGSRLNFGTSNNYGLNFQTNGVTRFSLDTTGNVVFSGQIAVPILYTQTLANLTGTTSLAQLTLTDDVNFSGGNFISDIPIAKGSVPSFGTTDNYGLNLKTNNVTRLHIDTSGNANITNSLDVPIINTNNISADGDIDFSGTFISDLNISKGSIPSIGTTDDFGLHFKTNGVQRLHLDTTGNAILTGTMNANKFNKVTITAPATSATLTIANGKTLTVNNSIALTGTDATTMTLPSTNSTLAGLENTNTWSGATNTFTDIVGNYIKTDNTYVATKVVQSYISATGTINIAHGLGGEKWKDITNLSMVVIHDSTGAGNYRVFNAGYNGNTPNNTGLIYFADSLNINYTVPSTSTGLIGDTVKITIQYHK